MQLKGTNCYLYSYLLEKVMTRRTRSPYHRLEKRLRAHC